MTDHERLTSLREFAYAQFLLTTNKVQAFVNSVAYATSLVKNLDDPADTLISDLQAVFVGDGFISGRSQGDYFIDPTHDVVEIFSAQYDAGITGGYDSAIFDFGNQIQHAVAGLVLAHENWIGERAAYAAERLQGLVSGELNEADIELYDRMDAVGETLADNPFMFEFLAFDLMQAMSDGSVIYPTAIFNPISQDSLIVSGSDAEITVSSYGDEQAWHQQVQDWFTSLLSGTAEAAQNQTGYSLEELQAVENLTVNIQSGAEGSGSSVIQNASDLGTIGTDDFYLATTFTLNSLNEGSLASLLNASTMGTRNWIEVYANTDGNDTLTTFIYDGTNHIRLFMPLDQSGIQIGVEHTISVSREELGNGTYRVAMSLDGQEVTSMETSTVVDLAAFDEIRTGEFIFYDGTVHRPADGEFGGLVSGNGTSITQTASATFGVIAPPDDEPTATGANIITDASDLGTIGTDDFYLATTFTLNSLNEGSLASLLNASTMGTRNWIEVYANTDGNDTLTTFIYDGTNHIRLFMPLDQSGIQIGVEHTISVSREELGNGTYRVAMSLDGQEVTSMEISTVVDLAAFDEIRTGEFIYYDGTVHRPADGEFGGLVSADTAAAGSTASVGGNPDPVAGLPTFEDVVVWTEWRDLGATYTVNNTANGPHTDGEVEFWFDMDGNGVFSSSADKKFGTERVADLSIGETDDEAVMLDLPAVGVGGPWIGTHTAFMTFNSDQANRTVVHTFDFTVHPIDVLVNELDGQVLDYNDNLSGDFEFENKGDAEIVEPEFFVYADVNGNGVVDDFDLFLDSDTEPDTDPGDTNIGYLSTHDPADDLDVGVYTGIMTATWVGQSTEVVVDHFTFEIV